MNDLERRLALVAKFVPETGYNLVGLDDYSSEIDGELYLIGHHEKRADAEVELAKRLAENPEGKYFIYGSG